MDTRNELEIYQVDGKDVSIVGNPHKLIVRSPWNWKRDRVILNIDNREYTILTDELIRAIENCRNAAP